MALNSLADDKLQATVRCLAPHGQLLEIGKYDILKNTPLGMRPLHANISFQGIDLDSLFKGVMQEQARAPAPTPGLPAPLVQARAWRVPAEPGAARRSWARRAYS